MTAATIRDINHRQMGDAHARRMKVLGLIRRRFNTTEMLIHRASLHERSVQRYTMRLESDGLIKRVLEVDGQGWRYRYQMTDAGMRALSG